MNEKPCLCPLHPTSKKKIRIHKSGNLIIQSIIKYNIDRQFIYDQNVKDYKSKSQASKFSSTGKKIRSKYSYKYLQIKPMPMYI